MPVKDLKPGILFCVEKTSTSTRIVRDDIKSTTMSAQWLSEVDKIIEVNVTFVIQNAKLSLSGFKVDESELAGLGHLPFDGGTAITVSSMDQTITQPSSGKPVIFSPALTIPGGKIGGAAKLRKQRGTKKK